MILKLPLTRGPAGRISRFGLVRRSNGVGFSQYFKAQESMSVNDTPLKEEKSDFAQNKKGFNGRKLFKYTLLSSIVLGSSFLAYKVYVDQHPSEPVPYDPSKKNLVILGSGWASTAILKAIDTDCYNVIVVSPRNYFLFTPLLPSTTTGTVAVRSIMEPVRQIIRNKKYSAQFYEGECTEIDSKRQKIKVKSPAHGNIPETSSEIEYEHLVLAVGSENATFGIPGVAEFGCFLKEVPDAQKIRHRIINRIEKALFSGQTEEEKKRLLHTVVVGGGPTGIEFSAELQDFFEEDLRKWYPEISDHFKVTLLEALPSVLPMFNKKLIDYTEKTFEKEKIDILTRTKVTRVTDREIIAEIPTEDGKMQEQKIPYGLLVWATGNSPRPLIKDLMSKIDEQKTARRGLLVNDFHMVKGLKNVWALGDCSFTMYPATAQVASQQGIYLGKLFSNLGAIENSQRKIESLKEYLDKIPNEADRKVILNEIDHNINNIEKKRAKIEPFNYTHQGSLAYIGSDKAIAEFEVPWFSGTWASGGGHTYLFWRSAYLSKIVSLRARAFVLSDWARAKVFGRDVSRV